MTSTSEPPTTLCGIGGSRVPRVLVDLSVAPSGGAATYTSGFIAGLIASSEPDKDQVVVLVDALWAQGHGEVLEQLARAGARVVEAHFPTPGTWRARLTRGRIVAGIVRSHDVDVAYFPRDAAPRLSVPTVVLLNNRYAWESFATGQAIGGRVPAMLLRAAARLTARRAAAVLAVSRAMGDAASGVEIRSVIHHGCSLPEHPRAPGGQVPGASGSDPVHVLMIGNMIENKGVETVIEGVAVARRRGGNWALRIHGTRMDPAYADRMEALSMQELGESVIHPAIAQAELVKAYQAAHILVMGGSFESFCHPLVEGMRSGCVVVAPDTDLVREICGDVAVTYREGDPDDLARALEQAGAELDQRSRTGVERSRAFDWVHTVDRTLAQVRAAGTGIFAHQSRSGGEPALPPEAQDQARVLLGLSVAPPGGAATYVAGMVHGIAVADIPNKDQLVVVLDQKWADSHLQLVHRLRASGVQVICRPFPPPGTWRARLGRGRALRRIGRRVEAQAAFFPREVGPSMTMPVVVLARNLYAWVPFASGAAIGGRVPAHLLRLMARRTAARAAAVLAVSEQIAAFVEPGPVAAVVHHGCGLPEHPRPPQSRPPEPTVVVTIANLMENKGIDTVIAGVAGVAELDDGKWDLRVYGGRSDPSYAQAMEDMSVDLLGSSVLGGPVYGDDLVDVYQAAHIVVVGSTFESFCHPLVEAMRSGCAVVAPAGVLVSEICGEVAVTYAEHDRQGLARALLRARTELDERSRLGIERSRHFTWEQTAERTVAAVRSVAAPRASG